MLALTPSQLGAPDWERVPVGQRTTTLTQYLNLRAQPKQWIPVPWFTKDGILCRMENNYRRPVTFGAKMQAAWAARGKIFRHYVLRQKVIQ
jgi:hypothetical protein